MDNTAEAIIGGLVMLGIILGMIAISELILGVIFL